MLTITDGASAFLSRILEEAKAPDEAAARFVVGPEGLSLQLDESREGDQTFEHDGSTVLLLDSAVADLLADKTLDVTIEEENVALVLHGDEDESPEAEAGS